MPLREQIEALATRTGSEFSADDRALFEEFKTHLNRGEIRAAERQADGIWSVNAWVRNRFAIGVGHTFNQHFTGEVYYLRQSDGRTKPGDLNVIGTTLRLRL